MRGLLARTARAWKHEEFLYAWKTQSKNTKHKNTKTSLLVEKSEHKLVWARISNYII